MQCQDFSTEFSTEGTDTGRTTSRCNRGHHIAHLLELVEVQCVELAGTPGGVDQIPLTNWESAWTRHLTETKMRFYTASVGRQCTFCAAAGWACKTRCVVQ